MKNEGNLKEYHRKLMEELNKRTGLEKQVEVISKVLGLSRSAAYKKINMNIAFSFFEVMTLAEHFEISLDKLSTRKSSYVAFQMDALRKMPEHPKDYLLNLLQHLNALTKLTNLNYVSLAGEVPVFHFMTFPNLFAFKLFSWNYSTWRIPSFLNQFDLESYIKDIELIGAMEKCAHTYYHFSGIEIWNIRLLDNTLDQMKFFIQLKMFKDKNTVRIILSDLEKFIEHLLKMCEQATKRFETRTNFNKSTIKIYMNEFIHSNEIISVNSNEGHFVFASIDTPNFIRTSDPKFNQHIHKWLENTIKHSTQISNEGEKDRKNLFNNLFQKLDRGVKEINNLLEIYYSD